MIVPPRIEPTNSNGRPNTEIRATEFMLLWNIWAIRTILHGKQANEPCDQLKRTERKSIRTVW